ncbi:plasmid recombination protein [Hymenobacter sp. BT507]|uniref:Plasmid recombination protein n=1 Tax=Hymenobacter citatus TaxID=2763506 RepID=A0ABR7MQK9_9BACT|nr:MobV family relaxase [Hymenobacter citatus]MBC6613371.1 plasmid recombination protein [Hymenobacter citatus]
MAFAIIRVTKITSREQAQSVAHHNYRTQETPNADPALRHLNQELVNHSQRSYWDLATERIAQLQLPRLRKDAVRAVEVLLTASEERFTKDPTTGQRADIRDSSWVKDNLDFLQKRYGSENVIGCMLHQDESTPHLHALVVPITQQQRVHKGEKVGVAVRLSARDLFNPVALRQLQTDYAQAMAPYGLQRGVMYSTARHEDVRRYYGAQKTTQRELDHVLLPVAHTPLEITKKAWYVDSGVHLQRELERLNHQAAQQLAEANAKLAEVGTIATANTLAQDRVRVLEKQLATSKAQHEQTKTLLTQKEKELAEKTTQLAQKSAHYTQLVVRTARGEALSPGLMKQVNQLQKQQRQRAEQVVGQVLRGPVTEVGQVEKALQQEGYVLYQQPDQTLGVRHPATAVEFPLATLRPNGQELLTQIQQAIERTQAEQEQQRREKLAQNPAALHAVIQARDAGQADRIEEALEKAGANVWSRKTLSEQRVELQVSYFFDWKIIEGISRVLDTVRRSPGAQLEESYANNTTRTGAARTLERDREHARRGPERGMGIG